MGGCICKLRLTFNIYVGRIMTEYKGNLQCPMIMNTASRRRRVGVHRNKIYTPACLDCFEQTKRKTNGGNLENDFYTRLPASPPRI